MLRTAVMENLLLEVAPRVRSVPDPDEERTGRTLLCVVRHVALDDLAHPEPQRRDQDFLPIVIENMPAADDSTVERETCPVKGL